MNTVDTAAIALHLGEISGKLDAQDRMLERALDEVKSVRHDNASTKTAMLLMNSRLEGLETKQTAMETKVTGLNTQVTNIFSVAAVVKMLTHWGPVTGAAAFTATLFREWIAKKLGFSAGP